MRLGTLLKSTRKRFTLPSRIRFYHEAFAPGETMTNESITPFKIRVEEDAFLDYRNALHQMSPITFDHFLTTWKKEYALAKGRIDVKTFKRLLCYNLFLFDFNLQGPNIHSDTHLETNVQVVTTNQSILFNLGFAILDVPFSNIKLVDLRPPAIGRKEHCHIFKVILNDRQCHSIELMSNLTLFPKSN